MTRWAPAVLLLIAAPLQAQTPRMPRPAPAPAPVPITRSRAWQTWTIDTAESQITFSVRHLVSRVQGRFGSWSGTLLIPSNTWTDGTADVAIQTASINTDNQGRDHHLRSADFFDAEHFPTITFKSTGITRVGDSVTVTGNLTMHGVTKPVVLTGKFLGLTRGARGVPARLAFKVTTTVNRLDYGVAYNRVVEGGGTVVGDDVTIEISVVAVSES